MNNFDGPDVPMSSEISLPPRLFVSYSHDDPDHKTWVLRLAYRLLANGVDVILDQFDLRLGNDIGHFIERGLRDSDRVLAICTDRYVKKANDGVGGAGYEKAILTAQIMCDLQTNRVIPVLRANPSTQLPTFLSGRFYLDFRDDNAYEEKYVELIRELHGKQVMARPPLGQNPFADGAAPILVSNSERYVSPAV